MLRECKLCQWPASASATSLHSMLHPYLTINQCYEQIILLLMEIPQSHTLDQMAAYLDTASEVTPIP